jgi:hypothetical protein
MAVLPTTVVVPENTGDPCLEHHFLGCPFRREALLAAGASPDVTSGALLTGTTVITVLVVNQFSEAGGGGHASVIANRHVRDIPERSTPHQPLGRSVTVPARTPHRARDSNHP